MTSEQLETWWHNSSEEWLIAQLSQILSGKLWSGSDLKRLAGMAFVELPPVVRSAIQSRLSFNNGTYVVDPL